MTNKIVSVEDIAKDFARYDSIINYFESNPERVESNEEYLQAISKSILVGSINVPEEVVNTGNNLNKRLKELWLSSSLSSHMIPVFYKIPNRFYVYKQCNIYTE